MQLDPSDHLLIITAVLTLITVLIYLGTLINEAVQRKNQLIKTLKDNQYRMLDKLKLVTTSSGELTSVVVNRDGLVCIRIGNTRITYDLLSMELTGPPELMLDYERVKRTLEGLGVEKRKLLQTPTDHVKLTQHMVEIMKYVNHEIYCARANPTYHLANRFSETI